MRLIAKLAIATFALALLAGCGSDTTNTTQNQTTPEQTQTAVTFALAGQVTKEIGSLPLEGVTVTIAVNDATSSKATSNLTVTTDADGRWQQEGLSGTVTITAAKAGWDFGHINITASAAADNIRITDRGAIPYVSDRDDASGHGDIWIMNQDGTAATRITTNDVFDFSPTISPDRKHLMFVHETETWDSELVVYHLDTATQEVLFTNVGGTLFRPMWSPDASKIAYEDGGDVWVMNADGTGKLNLTNSPNPPCSDYSASWSPDSTRLVFQSYCGAPISKAGIFIMNADGSTADPLSHPLRAAPPTAIDQFPSWSPNSDQIVFSTRDEAIPGMRDQIHIINADGTGLRKLTNQNTEREAYPRWSPDGNRIIYIHDDDVWSIDSSATEGEPTNLTNSTDVDSFSALT